VLRERLGLLRRSISVGIVTEKYPYKPIEVPEGFRGKPVIDQDKCLGCGACVNACPPNALSMTDDLDRGVRVIKLFLGRCIFCGRCQDVCPVEAIKLTREFELASINHNDLYQEVALVMAKCMVCGKPYTTIRLVEHVASNLPREQRSHLLLCPDCREKHSSKKVSYARW